LSLFFALVVLPAGAQTLRDTWVTDGSVRSVAVLGNVAYIGGTFTTVGPRNGGLASFATSDGAPVSGYPQIGGFVYSMIPDGSGGFYVGGDFLGIGGIPMRSLAHINANKTVDTAWNPNPNFIVRALALSGPTLYVCGEFTAIGGQLRNMIGAVNVSDGLATPWNPDFGPWDQGLGCDSLAVVGSTVFVGGAIRNVGGQPRNGFVALDATTGQVKFPSLTVDVNGFVHSMILANPNTLYVGGEFKAIGGQARVGIAAIDPTTGAVLPFNPNPPDGSGLADYVYSMSLSGSTLYVGGAFEVAFGTVTPKFGGQVRRHLAAIDVTGNGGIGTVTSWQPAAEDQLVNSPTYVRAVQVVGSTVYVAGGFRRLAGQPRNRLGAVDTAGNILPWNPNPNDTAWTFFLAGSTLHVGGRYSSFGGVPRTNLAAIDLTTGQATPWDPAMTCQFSCDSGYITDMVAAGSTIYIAGGGFTTVGGQARTSVAALNATTGQATAWAPVFGGVSQGLAGINDLDVSGSAIYIAGPFSTVNGTSRPRLAAVDATTGALTAFNAGLTTNDDASAIAVGNGLLYVGGFFTTIGGQSRNRLAALDLNTGQATGWNPNSDSTISAIGVGGNTVYVGGNFNTIGGQPRRYFAALDATTGQATSLNPGVDFRVDGIVVFNNIIYIRGPFDAVGLYPRHQVAAINVATGNVTAWDPQVNPTRSAWDMAAAVVAPNSLAVIVGDFFGALREATRTVAAMTLSGTAAGPRINHPQFNDPTLAVFTNQKTTLGTPTPPLGFRIGDLDTPADALVLTGSSSYKQLVPDANIVFAGSGENRTVTVTPAPGQSGISDITITVSDGQATASATFSLTAQGAATPNTPPTISAIVNQTTPKDVAKGPVAFTVSDAETPAASLILTTSSSNTTLLPSASVVLGGSGGNRTATLTPAAGRSGSSTVTITVRDAGNLTATTTFQLIVFPPPSAAAADAVGNELPVNSFTTFTQQRPAAAMAPDGRFVVVWDSGNPLNTTQNQDGSSLGVYRQQYDNNGNKSGGEERVNTFTTNAQFEPSVAMTSSGDFVVSWSSYYQQDLTTSNSGYGLEVWEQRYSANGAAQLTEFRVNQTTAGHQGRSDAAMDGSGNFVIVWDSNIAGNTDIFGRRFSSAGTPLGDEFPVNTYTSFHQNLPAVARSVGGSFVVVWRDEIRDGSGDSVWARLYDTNGVAQGSDFLVNTTTASSQQDPSVAMDSTGNFVVVWADTAKDGSNSGIFGRRYNSGGVALSGEFAVNTYTTGAQRLPSVGMEPTGGFLVTWESTGQDGSGLGIYGQRFNSDGVRNGAEFRVNTFTSSDQSESSASAGTGAAVVAWQSQGQDGDGPGIYAQLYSLPPPPPNPTIQLSAATYTTVESSNATITVTRAGDTSNSVAATYTLSPGTATSVADYTPANTTVTFASGETTKNISVVIIDDTVDEPDETLTVTLSNPTGGATLGTQTSATITITDDDDAVPNATGPFYLAEGATGFFDLEFAVANPNLQPAPIKGSFLKPDGSIVTLELTLSPTSRGTIHVNDIPGLENTALSTVVESKNGLPLVVERTMSWDRANGYGAHTEKAGEGVRRQWFFAEGSQGFFDTYILLANPQPTVNVATVTFLVEGGSPVTCTYVLSPTSRMNVYAGDIRVGGTCDAPTTALVNKSFGVTVMFLEPGASERAMYFGGTPFWSGGHSSVGVAAPATSWFHAEGSTGAFFDTYILVANPNPTTATVTYKYLLPSGVAITRVHFVPANSRATVNIAGESPLLLNTAVSTVVTSDLPVVSERAMYWSNPFTSWYEAHNSFGLTTTGTKWGLAEGRVGRARGYETFILLANPTDNPALVTITYLRTNGTTVVKTYSVDPTSRFNVYVNAMVPELNDEEFGAIIQSTQPIAVERALYWNALGQFWSAGTNATAARLP
jgi:hypothetical protein